MNTDSLWKVVGVLIVLIFASRSALGDLALAIADGGQTYTIEGADDAEAARVKALSECGTLTRSSCQVVGVHSERCNAVALEKGGGGAGWAFGGTAKETADSAVRECAGKATLRNKNSCAVASLHCDFRDTNRMAEEYSAVVRVLPTKVSAYRIRCYMRAIAGQLKEALADCDQAMRLKPPDYGLMQVLEARGFTNYQLGRFDQAIADYTAALIKEPRRPTSLYGRGAAKLKKGDRSGDADIAYAKTIRPDVEKDFGRPGDAAGRP